MQKSLVYPDWKELNAETLRLQFNHVVGYIRQNGTFLGTKMKPFREQSVRVNYYEAILNGTRYHYYETLSGRFVSAGKAR